MESITKNRQSPVTLRAMLERAYAPGVVPAGDEGWWAELGYGWFNVAYEVTLVDGRHVVIKIAPPPEVEVMGYEVGAMRIEALTLRLIDEQTDVPVPRVDFLDESHELVDADWFAMPLMPGENLAIIESGLSQEQRAVHWRQLGAVNRRINSVVGPGFGQVNRPIHPTWRAAFGELWQMVLSDAERRSVDIGQDHDELRHLFEAHADSLDEVTRPQLVEWDLWPGNTMVEDGRITGIIDHERAVFGDPLFEAGFSGLDQPGFGDVENFMAGYGQGPLTDRQAERRLLYSVYLMLVMTIETVYRGHTTSDQYDFAKERLALLVERLRAR